MKNLFFIIFILSSVSSFGQCVNLYVKEHIDGDPICRLSAGSTLEICLDTKTISGGACTFYIQSSRMNGDVQTYEFGLDKSTMYFYAPKYGDLVINTKTKKFGFIIDNNTGAYSYYSEAEMQKIREVEKEEQKQKQILSDKKITEEINLAMNNNQYFKAYSLLSTLNFENLELTKRVNQSFKPIKNELDSLYKGYLNDFELFKTKSLEQFRNNSSEFIEKNKALISKVNVQYRGVDGINYALKMGLKANDLAYLGKVNNRYIIFPFGYTFHQYTMFDTMFVDQIIINVNYNNTSNEIEPYLYFYKQNDLSYKFKIINPQTFNVNSISFDFTDNFKEKMNTIFLEGGSWFIENNYKQMSFIFDLKENIDFDPKIASKPEDGFQDKEFNDLLSIFSEIKYPIFERNPDFCKLYIKEERIKGRQKNQLYNFLLNPRLLTMLQKIKDKCSSDSIVMIFGYNGYELPYNISNTIKLVEYEYGDDKPERGVFHFLPLKKGSIELINKSNLRIYNPNGNYKDYKFDFVCETYTGDKIKQLLSVSSELKKRLKKKSIEYVYTSFYSENNATTLKYFYFTNNIIIPRMDLFNGRHIPKPDNYKIRFFK
jgi:hypothetical protein